MTELELNGEKKLHEFDSSYVKMRSCIKKRQ